MVHSLAQNDFEVENWQLIGQYSLFDKETTFSTWDYSLRNYLGSLNLNKYIKYSMKTPSLLLDSKIIFDRQAEVTSKVGYAMPATQLQSQYQQENIQN